MLMSNTGYTKIQQYLISELYLEFCKVHTAWGLTKTVKTQDVQKLLTDSIFSESWTSQEKLKKFKSFLEPLPTAFDLC